MGEIYRCARCDKQFSLERPVTGMVLCMKCRRNDAHAEVVQKSLQRELMTRTLTAGDVAWIAREVVDLIKKEL